MYTLKDVLEKGAINISLDLCGLYQQESFQSSYDLFNRAFPGGFPWEVTELIAGIFFCLSVCLSACVCLSTCRVECIVMFLQ